MEDQPNIHPRFQKRSRSLAPFSLFTINELNEERAPIGSRRKDSGFFENQNVFSQVSFEAWLLAADYHFISQNRQSFLRRTLSLSGNCLGCLPATASYLRGDVRGSLTSVKRNKSYSQPLSRAHSRPLGKHSRLRPGMASPRLPRSRI